MQTPIVALIYDFDKTLSPRDMEEYSFLPGIKVEPDAFWGKCAEFAREHDMDGILTYMYLMKKMASGEMELTKENLIALGRDVEFFPGVAGWFDRINALGRQCGVDVEHYIISSGLTEIIWAPPSAATSRPYSPRPSAMTRRARRCGPPPR